VQKVQLVDMESRGDLCSTTYALAKPAKECLVLQPSETANPFTLTLKAGTYSADWYNVKTRKTKDTSNVTVDSDRSVSFTAPFAEIGPAVLYLKHAGL
jgi:hypothetical protein